ncbi:MAG: polysaccharide deacetylase family protein [Saprospiraceae bacterium]|nr:polysaccharide deacetylase family protein [Saprospiraceae bacterium]
MDKLLIYCAQQSNRLHYIFDELLHTYLGIDYQLTNHWDAFIANKNIPRLIYASSAIQVSSLPFLKANPFIFENHIRSITPQIAQWQGMTTLFPNEQEDDQFPFDLFSAAFFLLSRYEEYLPFEADQHGRFPATASIAYQHNFLHLPIIQHWCMAFAKYLQAYYPKLSVEYPSYTFIPTYDIDYAWSYLHKPILRQVGAMSREMAKGQWKRLLERAKVYSGNKKDPFDIYQQLDQWHTAYQLYPIFFFLLGDQNTYDKNIPHTNTTFQNLIQDITQQSEVGIHPSYQSNSDNDTLEKEISRLKNIIQQDITKSRQHYLKLSFPKTYHCLRQLGIHEDYSMGYAAAIGFRAGTALPFYWYDLTTDQVTDLKVFPFQLMDVSLKDYLRLSPNKAKESIQQIIEQCKQVGGTFIPLWHNSSFSELDGWEGWKAVYEYLLAQATSV